MSVQLRHQRFSVDTYDELVGRGILTSDDRVELLAGEIVEMSPIGSRHAACVRRLTQFFLRVSGERAIVSVQSPLALPPNSEPEPDIAILRPCENFYAQAHPRPSDVLLLIEVADSSLALDRTVKVPLYAVAGVAEVWIVDLTANLIEAYTRPENGHYVENCVVRGDTILTPTAFSELTLRVSDILVTGS